MIKVLQQHGFLAALVLILTIQINGGIIPATFTILILVCYVVLITMIIYKVKYFAPENKTDYRIVGIYFLWMITAGAIRGFFVAEYNYEFRDLISGIVFTSVPIVVYVYATPSTLWKTLHLWIWIAFPLFFIFYSWFLPVGMYQFFFGPLFLFFLIPLLPNKWKIILAIILLCLIVGDLGARSQSAKAAFVFFICIMAFFRKRIPVGLYSVVHWLCYIGPIVILYFAITGIYNPFEKMEEYQGTMYAGEEDLTADTRSILYEETIISAVKNKYIWHGRSLARGNDSWDFETFTSQELKTKKYERYGNEWCHPNIFTWLGLIGVFLFSFIYLKSSYLALYHSNNIWMKLFSMNIAFNWAWGWIENCLGLDILNVGIMMMIAMGFSKQFREMSDKEIEAWFISLFKWKHEEDIVA